MIFELLKTGAENAITSKELCAILDLNPRQLSIYIMRERRAGMPICASSQKPKGYYLAACREEMDDYCGRLWHRAGEIHKTRRACQKAAASLPVRQTTEEG